MFKKSSITPLKLTLISPALVASIFTAGITNAAEAPSAKQIKTAVADHTYQGSMTQDRFAEYYAADGSIKAEGYSGKWHVKDGEMCFQYGSDSENCWGVQLNGPALTLLKAGAIDGTGMLIEGNPYNFK